MRSARRCVCRHINAANAINAIMLCGGELGGDGFTTENTEGTERAEDETDQGDHKGRSYDPPGLIGVKICARPLVPDMVFRLRKAG